MAQSLREVDDPAGYLGVFIEVLACADAVIAVGDREPDAPRGATAYEQHRGQRATVLADRSASTNAAVSLRVKTRLR